MKFYRWNLLFRWSTICALSDRRYRPVERYWPYVEKPEEPTAEELAALDPDLHATLFGPRDLPFSITLVFSPFEGENYEPALEKARASAEYLEVGEGATRRHRARFFSNHALGLRDLFELVGPVPGTEVLIDDRPVPYTRELWLPLLWLTLLH
jgi:hypothetical protein